MAIKAGTLVTGLTAGAMVVIAVLAAQASGSAPKAPAAAHSSAPPPKSASVKPKPRTYPLPLHSGVGKRVVYSVSAHRVWLVDDGSKVVRTYAVVAGNVTPSKGLHHVFFRREVGVGGDGKQVEHTVLFAMTGGVNIGFSAAVDGSLATPDPAKQNAAIRATRADTAAMWQFATVGSAINVLP
ncbi:hypothetical protein [Actinacidiphila paucisporea]|uniref:L,D-transpeptidase n=1 Tax=Actinacidiphila paucisporea TaxID=310782 RepID=A0A1M6TX84_9ACTN|nr:hypothetical protein [Actinacidiphila paucisporea]SHK61536.1 hypothetical protein SAMN05216499_101177 [Actinacidiphila paucisporea]